MSCYGCGRIPKVSRCYINPSELAPWLHKDFSGRWCLHCPATYKKLHEGRYKSLTTFQQSHLSNRKLKAEFHFEVLGYCSLVKDGYQVKAGDLLERAAHLKWALRCLNLPIGTFAVQLLHHAAQGEGGVEEVDESSLLSVISPEGDRLAIFVELDADSPMGVPGRGNEVLEGPEAGGQR